MAYNNNIIRCNYLILSYYLFIDSLYNYYNYTQSEVAKKIATTLFPSLTVNYTNIINLHYQFCRICVNQTRDIVRNKVFLIIPGICGYCISIRKTNIKDGTKLLTG